LLTGLRLGIRDQPLPERDAEPPGRLGRLLRQSLAHQANVAACVGKARQVEAARDLGLELRLRHLTFGLGQRLVRNDMHHDPVGAESARQFTSQSR
jgi:hypothetical protein